MKPLRKHLSKKTLLHVTNIITSTNPDQSLTATIILKDPIPYVQGSQNIYNPLDGRKYHLSAMNVKEIHVHEDNIKYVKYNDHSQTLTFSPKHLMFDVAKSGTVWLTHESFESAGARLRREHQQRRVEQLLSFK